MIHLDLFSGIGGFAYAIDQVWPGADHIFCDNNKFCQKVLDQHWPESRVFNDIRDITEPFEADIVTGGFPCQPFSQAGKKRGTADNRYLWPEMFRVIQLTEPEWVIAENVAGLVRWNSEMVFEQICTDLEDENYEVWPFVIPALAVNAPHRRDRVWFVAHSKHIRRNAAQRLRANSWPQPQSQARQKLPVNEPTGADSIWPPQPGRDWWGRNWTDVTARVCRVDNGIPNRVDRIKSLGNAIVPQVAIEIMEGIKANAKDKTKNTDLV